VWVKNLDSTPVKTGIFLPECRDGSGQAVFLVAVDEAAYGFSYGVAAVLVVASVDEVVELLYDGYGYLDCY